MGRVVLAEWNRYRFVKQTECYRFCTCDQVVPRSGDGDTWPTAKVSTLDIKNTSVYFHS